MTSLAFAVALVVIAALAWDAARRHIQVQASRNAKRFELDSVRADVKAETEARKRLEAQHVELLERVKKLAAKVPDNPGPRR